MLKLRESRLFYQHHFSTEALPSNGVDRTVAISHFQRAPSQTSQGYPWTNRFYAVLFSGETKTENETYLSSTVGGDGSLRKKYNP